MGKSTLFNRILKKREAIVDHAPGVTRDRHYAIADWNGKYFMMVDTGGYMPDSKQIMDVAIREQVEIAIQEADLILFVVDQATGITDIDEEISQKLRRSDKPALLVVNKVDNLRHEGAAFEFYNLGLGDPALVSASLGRGIGDLLDQMISKIGDGQLQQESEGIKLAVIGKENVGKSSFVNTLIGKERIIVTPIPGTTRDPIDTPLKYKQKNYLLIDTAGLKRRAKVKENILFYSQLRSMRSIQRADVVLYFMDATEGLTRQDMRVLAEAVQAKRGVVAVVNKWDLIEKDERTLHHWEKELKKRFGTFKFIPVVFTSVLQKQRLYKLLDEATFVYEEYHKKIRTSDLNKVLLPIIKENTPPAVQGREIKINYITQLQTAPPVFGFFGNHPELIPENYRRFLERQIRSFWEFKGVPITIALKSKHR